MRCFLAIVLPKEIREELQRIQKELKDLDFEGKFVEIENLHLTLKFFGEIQDNKLNEIKEALKQVKFTKFQAKLDKLGFFSPSFIRVIWISLEPSQLIKEIHKKIEDSIEFKKDREFESHITLARVKNIKDKRSFIKALERIKLKPLDFEVNSFVLKKSILTPKGPIYEDILKIELK